MVSSAKSLHYALISNPLNIFAPCLLWIIMGKVLKYLWLLTILISVKALHAQQVAVRSPVRFLALGDSYTIGQGVPEEDRWPVQLVKRLGLRGVETEKLSIIAQTGWRTDDLKDAIAREKPDSTYNLVSLLIGVNNQYQGMDIARYPDDFRELLETAIALCGGDKEGVFVLSIPDYGYTPFGQSAREMISAEINAYNQINRDITSEMDIAYFDITPISREALSKPEYLASDNLHPSGEMYARWVDFMFETSGLNIITKLPSTVNENTKVLVVPNPAKEELSIRIARNAHEIVIYNSLGLEKYHKEISTQTSLKINVSDWQNGIYFYRVSLSDNVFLRGKFLVL